MIFYVVLLAASLLLGGKVEQEGRTGKDYAIFFANQDYRSHPNFGNLKNPIKDAKAIAQELEEMYGFETKVYEDYNQDQIFKVLERWQERSFGEKDQLFVFFSGHGAFREFNKTGYFVPKTNKTTIS